MSKSTPQTLQNHNRFDPLFHFFLAIVVIANLVIAIVNLVRSPANFHAEWTLVLSVAAVVLVFKLRLYPMKVQDRVIEEIGRAHV